MTSVTATLHEDEYTFLIISSSVLLRMRHVSDKSCIGNQNTQFIFNRFFFSENPAVFEVTWKNMVKSDSPHTTHVI